MNPHPEGGFFKETYRDSGKVSQAALPDDFKGDRNFSTAIVFLLPLGNHSNLHRMAASEVWHFYFGRPVIVTEITLDGKLTETTLGADIAEGQKCQYTVPPAVWFGARSKEPDASQQSILGQMQEACDYSFVGCTVAPGFDFADFELGERGALLSSFPQHNDVIQRLTREPEQAAA
ncbi:hypothetical protein WJX74_001087 [Apatococcus lobatus]|uniref:DUF985 domain-containing protein n=1 Tax=Apatococcus lobatus TaxID=904363 RepID=A0AAW1S2X4_9CHLO